MEGDSFILEAYTSDTIFLYIDSVRYIPWGGKMRKHIFSHSKFYDTWPETVWIEGVGNICNPSRSSNEGFGGSTQSLLCFEEEGNLVYQDPEYNTCYVNNNSAQIIPKNEDFVSVFATGEGTVHVDLVQDDTGTLYLYTPDGKLILKHPLTAPETTLCAPGAGLFLYRFVSEQGEMQSGKLIVK
ncbi:MAG: hypothetical protein JW798_02855 [Prolixibacteraceae bacterium]|nr:hypothetical protein [Prolixibacteraceae bacterium]